MITKITMNGVASFTSEACLETDKKVNFIYGLNGSGKTTISNYLKDMENQDFEKCRIEGFNQDTQKILVYNQRFVEANFYESETQKGIFTLAQENKEALQSIETAKTERKNLQEKLDNENDGLHKKLAGKEQNIKEGRERIQEKTWEIKTKYTGGDRIFDENGFLDFLEGKKRKKVALFQYIESLDIKDTTKTIDEIKTELQALGKSATTKPKLQTIQADAFSAIETDPIFREEIIGNQNSTVSNLISMLQNADWVRQGMQYFPQDNDQICPFCQQPTLTISLQEEIKNYFDKTYEEKVDALKRLQNCYALNFNDYKNENQDNDTIRRFISELKEIFNENTNLIRDKIARPAQSVSLKSTTEKIEEINGLIEEENKKIREFNQKLADKQNTIEALKTEFWNIQRKEYDKDITDYQNIDRKLEKEKQDIGNEIKTLEDNIKQQNQIISECQKQTFNIDQKIEEINKHLLDFGIEDFKIARHDENYYRIQRDHEDSKTKFKSLSEGEKTVISFLYFVELCKGKESSDDTKEKIVVIDDPISSLSHMCVFNIAVLLKDLFDKKDLSFLQFFVFTHNLYFYNELVGSIAIRNGKPKKCQKLFRVMKKDNISVIVKLEPGEIQNEYQAYWSIINDKENKFTMANAMRNIVEYFFGFVENKSIDEILKDNDELKKNKYGAFKRYINRESHSDQMNVSDYKDFDCEIFKDAFEKMFEVSGYKKHYDKMIK